MPPSVLGPFDSDCLQAFHSTDSAWILTDASLRVVRVNDGFTRMFGYTLEDMQGMRPLQKLLGNDDELSPHIREQLTTKGSFCGELEVRHRDGHAIWVAVNLNTLDRQPMPIDATVPEVIVLSDIGFTKKFEALQRQMLEDVVAELPLEQLLHNMACAVEQITPSTSVCVMQVDANGMMYSLAAPRLPAHIVQQLQGMRVGAETTSCSSAAFRGHEVVTENLLASPLWQGAAPVFVHAGLQACWSNPIKNRDGQVIGTLDLYFGSPQLPNALHRQLVTACLHLCTIAMERETHKRRIRQLAYYDALTELPNRTMFNECAQLALHAHRHQPALLLFLDLDRFKLWNDSMGHAAGDALLREIAHRLGQCTRPEDVVGRISSDEFAVLMPHCSAEMIPVLVQRMLDAIAQPFSIQGMSTTPNACVGVCTYPEDGTDIETLLRHADQAMYAAKSYGSQWWERYRPEMGQITQERADMERALRQTLHEGGLQLHYQPQVHVHGDTVTLHGVEALARWQHPEWGWVPPQRFIALAEDTGLIHALTHWLLHASCQQLLAWREEGLQIPQISINLSTNNFHDPDFAQHVAQCLQRYQLGSRDLVLEITESVMLDNTPAAQHNLKALHAAGHRLAMDDFGTGYSSLSYLHRLPISELKLDKSFVQDVTSSSAAGALTRSVLNIAASLDMTVVAEGVETHEQAQWLNQQGCRVLQGYYFAKPMPPQTLRTWLNHGMAARSN